VWSIYQTCIDLSIYQTLSRAENHQVITIKMTTDISILMTEQICFQFILGLYKKLQKTFPEKVAKNFTYKKSWRKLYKKVCETFVKSGRINRRAERENVVGRGRPTYEIIKFNQSIDCPINQSMDWLIHHFNQSMDWT